MAVIAKVAVQAATYAIDKAYDYLLPEEVGGQAGDAVVNLIELFLMFEKVQIGRNI